MSEIEITDITVAIVDDQGYTANLFDLYEDLLNKSTKTPLKSGEKMYMPNLKVLYKTASWEDAKANLKEVTFDLLLLDLYDKTQYAEGAHAKVRGWEVLQSLRQVEHGVKQKHETQVILISAVIDKTADEGFIDLEEKRLDSKIVGFFPAFGMSEIGNDIEASGEGRLFNKLINRAFENIIRGRETEEKDRHITNLEGELKKRYCIDNIIGESSRMDEVFEAIHRVAPSKANVLLRGESGTGKELVAKAIHFMSPRSKGQFIKFNCASIPEGLLESELFGHEKGSFTGASALRKGRFEIADAGTIFLDEIGDLPLTLQPKILRVLQEKEFERVGGEKTFKVDVRLIAATSRNLEELVSAGLFREDLYYRLNVVPIFLPLLRERKEDIPLLTAFFLNKYNAENSKKVKITTDVMSIFTEYNWPGNVRELENTIERLVVMSNGNIAEIADIKHIIENKDRGNNTKPVTLDDMERDFILKTLKRNDGNIIKTAKELGLQHRQLRFKLNKYSIPSVANDTDKTDYHEAADGSGPMEMLEENLGHIEFPRWFNEIDNDKLKNRLKILSSLDTIDNCKNNEMQHLEKLRRCIFRDYELSNRNETLWNVFAEARNNMQAGKISEQLKSGKIKSLLIIPRKAKSKDYSAPFYTTIVILFLLLYYGDDEKNSRQFTSYVEEIAKKVFGYGGNLQSILDPIRNCINFDHQVPSHICSNKRRVENGTDVKTLCNLELLLNDLFNKIIDEENRSR